MKYLYDDIDWGFKKFGFVWNSKILSKLFAVRKINSTSHLTNYAAGYSNIIKKPSYTAQTVTRSVVVFWIMSVVEQYLYLPLHLPHVQIFFRPQISRWIFLLTLYIEAFASWRWHLPSIVFHCELGAYLQRPGCWLPWVVVSVGLIFHRRMCRCDSQLTAGKISGATIRVIPRRM